MYKLLVLLFFFLLGYTSLQAQNDTLPIESWRIGVPNGIWIQDSLSPKKGFYFDQTEIANIHWLEYIASSWYGYAPEFVNEVSIYPDTTVWEETAYYQAALKDTSRVKELIYIDNYLRYPGFRYYPVVGISQAQARDFCRWRSIRVNEILEPIKINKQWYQPSCMYRLPTDREWKVATTSPINPSDTIYGFSNSVYQNIKEKHYKKIGKHLKKEYFQDSSITENQLIEDLKKIYQTYPYGVSKWDFKHKHLSGTQYNIKYPTNYIYEKIRTHTDEDFPTEYIYAYPPNDQGLYNLMGNVAEWIDEEGMTKGGSWNDKIDDYSMQNKVRYDAPSAYVGFRCVCEVFLTPISEKDKKSKKSQQK